MTSAGYSGTPLWQKIGIQQGHRVAPLGMPRHVAKLLAGAPTHEHVDEDADIVWWFVSDEVDLLEGLPDALSRMRRDGMLWISWPKKGSRLHHGLMEGSIRDAGLAAGLVDVKVCAVDEDWSGLKFVYRRADR